MKALRFAIVMTITSLLLMLSAVLIGRNEQAQAQSVASWQTVTLLSSVGVTQPVTGTAVYLPNYGIADCYSIISVTDLNTATVHLQHGPNTTKWIDLYDYAAVDATGNAFTRTLLYGNYTRAWAEVALTTPITITVQCVAKNQ